MRRPAVVVDNLASCDRCCASAILSGVASSPGLEPNSAKRNSWWQRWDGGPPGALRQQSDPGPGFVPSASPAVSCHAMHSTFPHIGLRDHRTLRASVKDASFDFKTENSHLSSDGQTSLRRIFEQGSPSTLALLCTSELPIKRAAG
ncbi:hypothetical protein HPB52_014965 [Rhipicephalus sanguineus]|uniref:Uncharacterized protein n=1 Tax=Rhipicephalus sanguineus TaxID=34632 RepID=A0A9D4PMK6_RHISA|nr:hypothetical protein HPB52_014965 [Rhipicephalus sanguineus]